MNLYYKVERHGNFIAGSPDSQEKIYLSVGTKLKLMREQE